MEHPSDGMIQALLDGETAGSETEIRDHLSACPRCRSMAGERSRRLDLLREALSLLDAPPPSRKAREDILRRGRAQRSWARVVRRNLPRAASIVLLLTAGAAAALPGSPVRSWLGRGWAEISRSGGEAAAPGVKQGESGPPEDAVPSPGAVGATIPATGERIELRVSGLRPGASLIVLLVGGDEASIFAEEGTRFRSQAGGLEATDPPGDVTLEIPASAPEVRLMVNGRLYLAKRGEELDILGPVSTRTPTEIRFAPIGEAPNVQPSRG